MARWRRNRVIGIVPGKGEGHGVPCACEIERGPYVGIARRRTKAHHDIVRADDRLQPGPVEQRQIQSRQGLLADDYGMHEFDRDMLGVGRIGAAPEGQQAASPQEAIGHLAASDCQAVGLLGEECAGKLVPLEKLMGDAAGPDRTCPSFDHNVSR